LFLLHKEFRGDRLTEKEEKDRMAKKIWRIKLHISDGYDLYTRKSEWGIYHICLFGFGEYIGPEVAFRIETAKILQEDLRKYIQECTRLVEKER